VIPAWGQQESRKFAPWFYAVRERAIGIELPLVRWSLGAWTQGVVVRRAFDRTLELGQGSGCALMLQEPWSVGQCALGRDTSRAWDGTRDGSIRLCATGKDPHRPAGTKKDPCWWWGSFFI
jgi:hypothetical protein